MTGYLTTHVLDTARGCPADGISIALYRVSGNSHRKIAEAVTNEDGRTDAPILPENMFKTGSYELIFFAGDYLQRTGQAGADPLFLDAVPIRFGMAEDTGRILNKAITQGWEDGTGMGEAIGRYITKHPKQFPYRRSSLLAAGVRLGVPVTVHVAIGTDIIHMHPHANGEAIGAASLVDFRKLAVVVSQMEGGVYINLGSAVLMPEVFLKTVTLGRNLGKALKKITTVNMDFLPHYRPLTNVVKRPTQKGGKGYTLTGHHELMVPLLAGAVLEALRR